MPDVSVILPTFNRLTFLRESVASVLAQTYADWELVIADDGSSQATRDYLASLTSPQFRVLWLSHCGNPSRVRNAAIASASGRYLAFLDSDDVWAPTKLEQQIRALQESSSSQWSYTLEDVIRADGSPFTQSKVQTFEPRDGWVFEPLLKLELAMSMPTIVASSQLVRDLSGFDEKLLFGEWHDLCLRLALRSEVVVVREPLCSIRTHQEHYSADRIGEQAGWIQLFAKMERLVGSDRLRACCRHERARAAVRMAAFQIRGGAYGSGLATLTGALPYGWRFPDWWRGAGLQLAQPLVPQRLIATLRRHD
jgi:glycosyltransferase involved in cell wall biosynthesis